MHKVEILKIWRVVCRERAYSTASLCNAGKDYRISTLHAKSSESVQSACWRPVMHVQTWTSYSAVYQFGSLSHCTITGPWLCMCHRPSARWVCR